jgi:hypothetical protein
MIAMGILSSVLWLGLPALKAYTIESALIGAADIFKGEFRRARSVSIRTGRKTALRFEERDDGVYLGMYSDGNYNGVLSREIAEGTDQPLEEPVRLADNGAVRVGIAPGVQEPPPGRGMLDPNRPIRFGQSKMVSFSPLGTATPGTLYLAGHGLQVAVRVTGTDARIRVMIWRGIAWQDEG